MTMLPFQKEQSFIGGDWRFAIDCAAVEVDNPATGEIIGSVPRCGRAETRAAIEAAIRRCRAGAPRRPRTAAGG